MGPKPRVPHEVIEKAVLSVNNVVDTKGVVKGPTHEVWKEVAHLLDGKLNPNHLYVHVKLNRYEVYTHLLQAKGIERPVKPEDVNMEEEEEEDEDTDSDSDGRSDGNLTKGSAELKPVTEFTILFTPQMYLQMKPVIKEFDRGGALKKRERLVLPQYKWEPIVVDALWDQLRLPCPYTFTRGLVKISPTRDCFIQVQAFCSECGATATGSILEEPKENEDVQMKWLTNDTRKMAHKKKRPLSHNLRDAVGEKLQGQSAAEYRKQEALNIMRQGDVEPPHLHSKSVLYKAKQNTMDKKLKLPSNSSDPITNLQVMKHSEPYAGSIHQIGTDPFFVMYHSPAQLHILKKIGANSYIVLAIDATGSLVRKVKTPAGRSSPHIFLYEGVIRAGSEQLPVLQMLSARQDANIIKFWMEEFLRQGAPIPHEVVMDHSKALINAAVVAFCGCGNLKEYYDRCVKVLSAESDGDLAGDLPKCFLRLDIAHLIGGAAKWSEWKSKATKRLKVFYMHCLGLLALEENPNNFRDTFVTVCVAANSEFTDSKLTALVQTLINRIEGLDSKVADFIESFENTESTEDDPSTSDITDVQLQQLLCEVRDDIERESSRVENGLPNPYYGPGLLTRFLYLLPDFLLWTGIMAKAFRSPTVTGSSARVESDFSVIKNGILIGEIHPLRIDKFVARHLNSINGSCLLAEAGDLYQDQQDRRNQAEASSNMDENEKETEIERALNESENWKGLSPPPKKKSKYLNSNPELSLVLNANALAPPKERILLNGLKKGFMVTKDGPVQLTNTCSFDSLAQMITSAYIQFECYRNSTAFQWEDNENGNYLMMTCQSLALNGAVSDTYLLRLKSLSSITIARELVCPTRSSKHKKSYVYDCFSDLIDSTRKLLPDIPSATVSAQCSISSCTSCSSSSDTHIVIMADVFVLAEEGIQEVGKAILVSLNMMENPEELPSTCLGMTIVQCKFGPHLLVSVDMYGSSEELKTPRTQIKLEDVPVTLKLRGSQFILCGVAARQPGHYVAYCRRATGHWEVFNDLTKSVKGATTTQLIQPVLLMYAAML